MPEGEGTAAERNGGAGGRGIVYAYGLGRAASARLPLSRQPVRGRMELVRERVGAPG